MMLGKKDRWCVYGHINKKNGKIYIGQTKLKPEYRWGKDGSGYKGQRFYDAIQTYGWENFVHVIFQRNLTKRKANEAEKFYIQYFNSTDPNHGYNVRQEKTHKYKRGVKN